MAPFLSHHYQSTPLPLFMHLSLLSPRGGGGERQATHGDLIVMSVSWIGFQLYMISPGWIIWRGCHLEGPRESDSEPSSIYEVSLPQAGELWSCCPGGGDFDLFFFKKMSKFLPLAHPSCRSSLTLMHCWPYNVGAFNRKTLGFSYLVPDNMANCGKKSVFAQIPWRQSSVELVLVQWVSDVFHCL